MFLLSSIKKLSNIHIACTQALSNQRKGKLSICESASNFVSCNLFWNKGYYVILEVCKIINANFMQISCCCEWSEIFSCDSLALSDLCTLCHELFSRPKDKYLIQGRSKENLRFELESLPFTVDLTSSKHLCCHCVNVLKKRRSLIQQGDIEKS